MKPAGDSCRSVIGQWQSPRRLGKKQSECSFLLPQCCGQTSNFFQVCSRSLLLYDYTELFGCLLSVAFTCTGVKDSKCCLGWVKKTHKSSMPFVCLTYIPDKNVHTGVDNMKNCILNAAVLWTVKMTQGCLVYLSKSLWLTRIVLRKAFFFLSGNLYRGDKYSQIIAPVLKNKMSSCHFHTELTTFIIMLRMPPLFKKFASNGTSWA